ncbi:MAG: glutathione peroxidase [Candidatus Aminicenantes bacterium RBG_16_63_16]|nr:MAG: glutathione peroxidase [Candidatus Aminicenantes bacterium RBG_16_63_16]
MIKHAFRFLIVLVFAVLQSLSAGMSSAGPDEDRSPLGFTMTTIDGDAQSLSVYKGKVVLIVNVASQCGLTPQYKALQSLYETYGPKGFVVLGFPANNFRGQEPGTDAEIKEFCSLNYGVTFPMFSKISVVGEDIDPLYAFLTDKKANPGFSGPIAWNFTKFVLDRQGRVAARFEPKVSPDSPEVIAVIERELSRH